MLYHSVSIFPVRAGGEILLQLRDDRPGLVNANCWSTVGGSIEPGETPLEAALREMAEETGKTQEVLAPAGQTEVASTWRENARLRIHLFGAAVDWSLDDLILGEGQGLDWFGPDRERIERLAPEIVPALSAFRASSVFGDLVANAPRPHAEVIRALPSDLPNLLGLRGGQLLALFGVPAGFAGSLRRVLGSVRLSASPSEDERPQAVLWWQHDGEAGGLLKHWRRQLAPGGSLWFILPAVLSQPLGTGEPSALAQARAMDWRETGMLNLADGIQAVRLVP